MELDEAVRLSKSKSDVCRFLGLYVNSRNLKKIQTEIDESNLDISHFGSWRVKYEKILKICPVCGEEFETQKGHPKEKTVCSHSCSNTYFRSGFGNGQFKAGNCSYRHLCFLFHEHKCVVCNEVKILEVHHYDHNRENNKIENLIPLCPTHHKYWHSKYRSEILEQVEIYREKFLKEIYPKIDKTLLDRIEGEID